MKIREIIRERQKHVTRSKMELKCGVIGIIEEGNDLVFKVSQVNVLGTNLAVIVGKCCDVNGCAVDCCDATVDVILKNDRDVTFVGEEAPKTLGQWAQKLYSYHECAIVRGRVVEVEHKRSKRGNLQIHLTELEILSFEKVCHSDDEIFGCDNDGLENECCVHSEMEGSKEERNALLCEWMDNVFDWQSIKEEGAVLDVGGGKGELCSVLSKKGLACILMDPREKKRENEPFTRICQSLTLQNVDSVLRDQKIALVVAMHADQGTEPALLFALKRNIDCCIVPCCVFPDSFPERKFRGGGVRVYKTFFKYLMEKCREQKREPLVDHLPFKGRNTILYIRKCRKMTESELSDEN